MRYLGLLTLTFSLAATPALARKQHHKRPKPMHAARQVAPPPRAPEPPPTRVAQAEPPRAPILATAQENDDEVPGARRKK